MMREIVMLVKEKEGVVLNFVTNFLNKGRELVQFLYA